MKDAAAEVIAGSWPAPDPGETPIVAEEGHEHRWEVVAHEWNDRLEEGRWIHESRYVYRCIECHEPGYSVPTDACPDCKSSDRTVLIGPCVANLAEHPWHDSSPPEPEEESERVHP